MNKTVRKLTALLACLALLLALVPAATADAAAAQVIYDRTAVGDVTQDMTLAWVSNVTSAAAAYMDTEGRKYATFNTRNAGAKGEYTYIDVDLDYAMDDSGTTLPPYGVNFDVDAYEAVHLTFTYAFCYNDILKSYDLGRLGLTRVYLSCDNGKTWTQDYVGIDKQTYLGAGTMTDGENPEFSLFEVTCDLTDILPKDGTVTNIRIMPVGEHEMHAHASYAANVSLYQVKVLGYKKAFDAPDLSKPDLIPMDEDTMRAIVVEHAKRNTAGFEWTPAETNGYFIAGITYRGMGYAAQNSAGSSSYEKAVSVLDDKGVSHSDVILGTDGGATMSDILTRVAPVLVNGTAHNLSTGWLTPLGDVTLKLPGSNEPNYRTGHGGVTAEMAYESYALVKPGDVFISTAGSTQTMLASGAAKVVRTADGAIDPNASTIKVINTPVSAPSYVYDVDGKQVRTTAVPDTYLASNPSAKVLYGTVFCVDHELTFYEIWNGKAATTSTPVVRSGHMAFTMNAYTQGGVEAARIDISSSFDPDNARAGVILGVDSSYRLISGTAVLTDLTNNKILYEGEHFFRFNASSSMYEDLALNDAMAVLTEGSYRLEISIKSGPVTDLTTLEVPSTKVMDETFTVRKSELTLTADRTLAHQGEQVTLTVAALGAADRIKAGISYDMNLFELDVEATRKANPGIDIQIDNLTQTVKVDCNAAQIELIFTALRSGSEPILGGDAPRFTVTDNAVARPGGTLTDGFARGNYVPVELGYNLKVFRDYLPGWDLVLVFTMEIAPFTYDGHPMYNVSQGGYLVDGLGFPCTYAWLAPNADTERLAPGAEAGADVNCGADANLSGWVDLADAQQVANVLKGAVTPNTDMARCIAADVNKDGKVTPDDVTAIWDEIR